MAKRPDLSGLFARYGRTAPPETRPEKPSIPEGFFAIGQLGQPHGLDGALRLHWDVDDPADYTHLRELLIWDGRRQTTYALAAHERLEAAVSRVKLAGVDSATAAEALAGHEVLLPVSALKPLGPTQFYYHEVAGCRALDAAHGELGTIVGVSQLPGQDALRIAHPSGAEVWVPIVDAFVGTFDRAARTLHLSIPEGLLEVYLSPEGPPDTAEG